MIAEDHWKAVLARLEREQQLAVPPSERAALRDVLKLIEEELQDGRHGDKLVAKAKLEFAKYD